MKLRALPSGRGQHPSTSWDDYSAVQNNKRADVRLGSNCEVDSLSGCVRYSLKLGHRPRSEDDNSATAKANDLRSSLRMSDVVHSSAVHSQHLCRDPA
jgi:hypothetical protein